MSPVKGYEDSHGRAGLLWCCAALALSLVVALPAVAQQECSQVPLSGGPGWTISGAWQGSRLLVADALNNRILQYRVTEDSVQAMVAPLVIGNPDRFLPSALKSRGPGLVLELAPARLQLLDQNNVPVGEPINVFEESAKGETSVESMFLWALTQRGDPTQIQALREADLLTFSDIQTPAGWKSGFLRIPLGNPRAFSLLREMTPQDPSRLFYRLGHPYITTLGETGYFLVMDDIPAIYKNEKGSSRLVRLAAFPAGLGVRPSIPNYRSAQGFRNTMRAVEGSSMPTGLFGWGNELFVVARRASEKGTQWQLTRIDPERDAVVGTVDLPTKAQHLTVVPGPEHWAFIEKGRVIALGQQKTESILYVPSARIRTLGQGALCSRLTTEMSP